MAEFLDFYIINNFKKYNIIDYNFYYIIKYKFIFLIKYYPENIKNVLLNLLFFFQNIKYHHLNNSFNLLDYYLLLKINNTNIFLELKLLINFILSEEYFYYLIKFYNNKYCSIYNHIYNIYINIIYSIFEKINFKSFFFNRFIDFECLTKIKEIFKFELFNFVIFYKNYYLNLNKLDINNKYFYYNSLKDSLLFSFKKIDNNFETFNHKIMFLLNFIFSDDYKHYLNTFYVKKIDVYNHLDYIIYIFKQDFSIKKHNLAYQTLKNEYDFYCFKIKPKNYSCIYNDLHKFIKNN